VVADASDASPTRARRQALISASDHTLRANPAWGPPDVVEGRLQARNGVSAWIYSAPGMREWRQDLVPTARALFPMQRPESTHLPSGGEIDSESRSFFLDALDSIGIRTRAALMQEVVGSRTRALREDGAEGTLSWVSLACGAAVPVLDALAELDTGQVHLWLVDMDPAALAFAVELAAEQDLLEGRDLTVLQRNLVSAVVVRDTLVSEIGEGTVAVVDALGIFEYFADASCVRLLRNAYRMLRPGGTLVVANMLSDRREIDFNQRGIGWPKIYPRTIEQVLALVERAGLPLDRTTVTVPQDGVYAVLDVLG
jgi:SAM-dependent methyltransferase